jgi:hypothetical protein
MVHSDLIHRGGESKEKILIARFQEFNPNKEKDWHYGEKGEAQDDPTTYPQEHPNPFPNIPANGETMRGNEGVPANTSA